MRRAFTFIELVLVVLIIATLAGLSTPIFRRAALDLILKDSSFNISKLITYGQEKSIIDRLNYKINFDFEASKYWLSVMDNSTEVPTYKKVEGRFGKVFTLPRGVSLEGLKNEIIFFPDGHSDETAVDLLDSKGAGYRMLIKGFAGRIEIERISSER